MQRIFAQKLRQLRLSHHLTQAQLAQKLQKSESTVRMWELDKNEPDFQTLQQIAGIFAVSCDELLGFALPSSTLQAISPPLAEIIRLCQEATPEQQSLLLRITQATLQAE